MVDFVRKLRHEPMMPRTALATAVAVALVLPAPAAAADLFVGKSRPAADDSGPCTAAAAPCETIQAAVDKSEAQGGGAVRVLANPDGETTDGYAESVTLDGSQQVTLLGAGTHANGTLLAPSGGTPLTLSTGTTARSLAISDPGGTTAVDADAGSTLGDARVEAAGIAYSGAGRVEDSLLIGETGARLDDGARFVRTSVVATVDGIVARLGTSQLLQVVVRARTTLDVPPVGDALRVGGAGGFARAELRHVTLTGYATRARLDGRTARASMQAVNATFAGAAGTDLQLRGSNAGARIRTVNRSPARTLFSDGAAAGSLQDTDPVNVDPALTPDANLSPTSPLIDRGTRDGLLAGNADNATDINGAPRVQGANPDIGADESRPASPDGLRWVTMGSFRDPMYVAAPPGDLHRVFVVERLGKIFAVEDGQTVTPAALDIGGKVTGNSAGGIQSIVFAPDFAVSKHVYGFYTRQDDPLTPVNERGDIVIAEWTMLPGNPNKFDAASEREVMYIEHPDGGHNGGGMQFGPDGYLYFTVGDGDEGFRAQDLSSLQGKVFRIDPHQSGPMGHSVPPGNPFVGVPGAIPEIWAYGLRNPFRMGSDVETGDLWIGDVGHNRYEELNILRAADGMSPGANFGWRTTEGDVIFESGDPVTPANAPTGYVAPAVVRTHDEAYASVTAGTGVYDPTIPELAGKFLYGDFILGSTRAAVAAPGGVSSDDEIEELAAIPGITSYNVDGCNRVWATQLVPPNALAGKVYRLTTTGQCVPPPSACTVTGTAGADVLTGTAGADVVCGFGGNDRLLGLGGADTLSGGPGDDELVGGPGGDTLQGGTGSDLADYSASTQPVNVTIGSGIDDGEAGEADEVQLDVERVKGGSQDDHLTAGSGPAKLLGGDGADVLLGSDANDTLDGEQGDDEVEGAGGEDQLVGGRGGDDLKALDGRRDRLVCGKDVDSHQSDAIDVVDASCE